MNQYVFQISDIKFEICRWMDLESILNLHQALNIPIPLIYVVAIIKIIKKCVPCGGCDDYCSAINKLMYCNTCKKMFCPPCVKLQKLRKCFICYGPNYCGSHCSTFTCTVCQHETILCNDHKNAYTCLTCKKHYCNEHISEFLFNQCEECSAIDLGDQVDIVRALNNLKFK